MKTLRRLCVTIVGLLLLVGCEDRSEDLSNTEIPENIASSNTTINQEQLTPMILGEKLENPFSVKNMQKALNSLIEETDELENAGVSKRNAEILEISPTDWYICFKVDSTQFHTLISDTTLALSQVPLDREIIQHGDYLEEFQKSEIKTLYTTVKPGYTNPNGIDFEILEELFIPENSELYSEDSEVEKRSLSSDYFGDDFVSLLLKKSFTITGNERFLASTSQVEKRQLIQGKKTSYYPEGKISFQTTKGYEPVKGVKIVMWRWFTRINAVTDKNGYFISTTKLNKILIGNNVQYYMNMTGQNENQKWHLDANLFGVLCFWVNEYNLGSGSPDYVEFKIDASHKAWRQCLANNAIYDYVTYVRSEGLTLPPNNLRIAVGDNGVACSAPLFNKYFNAEFEVLLNLAETIINYHISPKVLYLSELIPPLTLLNPDIMVNCTNDYKMYYSVYSSIWHELSHGAHLQAMINNKGKDFATKYWTTVVHQEAFNSLKDMKNTYGQKGDDNWEYIALAEGWACYRQKLMCSKHINYNHKIPTYSLLITNYSNMYFQLKNIGISDKQLENSLSVSNSINSFKINLLNQVNNTKQQNLIKEKFKTYE